MASKCKWELGDERNFTVSIAAYQAFLLYIPYTAKKLVKIYSSHVSLINCSNSLIIFLTVRAHLTAPDIYFYCSLTFIFIAL